MESIVSNIRSRLTQDKILKMSNEELQSKVMEEINNEKKKAPTTTVTSKMVLNKRDMNLRTQPDSLPLDTSTNNTFARGGDPYQEDTDETDLKHDRRDQLLASNAFDNMVQR
jgi:hypothetical protein